VDLVENFYGDKYNPSAFLLNHKIYDKLIICFFVVWYLIVKKKRKIGHWHSWKKDGLDIYIYRHVPPEDGPDNFHLKVAFLEEPPFISIVPPDPA
jgi:hypothetical protein